MSVGEEKEIDVTFPEQYQAENLAGKQTKFKIKLHTVLEPKQPELNDEFFALFDVKEGGMDAFRSEIKLNMERELDAAVKAKVKDQVMAGLEAHNEVSLPKALVEQEVNRMRQEAVQRFGGDGAVKLDPSMLPAEMFSEQAEKRVKLGLIVNSIVETNKLVPDTDKVRETIESLAASYEQPEQVVSYYYNNEAQLSQVQNMVLEEQIVDFVLAKAVVTDKVMPYEAAVKKAEPGEALESSDDAETA